MGEALSEPFAGLGPAGEALLGIGGQDMPVSYAEVRVAMDAFKAEIEAPLLAKVASLEEDSTFLNALRAHGVDNWEGYDDACASPDPFGDDD